MVVLTAVAQLIGAAVLAGLSLYCLWAAFHRR